MTKNQREITENLRKEEETIIMISSQKIGARKISGLLTNMEIEIETSRDMTMSSLGIACNSIIIITTAVSISKPSSNTIRIQKMHKLANSNQEYQRVICLRLLTTGYSTMKIGAK